MMLGGPSAAIPAGKLGYRALFKPENLPLIGEKSVLDVEGRRKRMSQIDILLAAIESGGRQ
jgi:hypothetical protein